MVFRVRLKKYINTRLAGGVAGSLRSPGFPAILLSIEI
jgi:hypothetical protein